MNVIAGGPCILVVLSYRGRADPAGGYLRRGSIAVLPSRMIATNSVVESSGVETRLLVPQISAAPTCRWSHHVAQWFLQYARLELASCQLLGILRRSENAFSVSVLPRYLQDSHPRFRAD